MKQLSKNVNHYVNKFQKKAVKNAKNFENHRKLKKMNNSW